MTNDDVLFLVMRTQGSLRVVLNTKLWPSMTLEKGNEKSLRITAMDSEKDIKIYLIMVSTSSVSVLSTWFEPRGISRLTLEVGTLT